MDRRNVGPFEWHTYVMGVYYCDGFWYWVRRNGDDWVGFWEVDKVGNLKIGGRCTYQAFCGPVWVEYPRGTVTLLVHCREYLRIELQDLSIVYDKSSRGSDVLH